MSTIPLSLYVHFPWCVKKCPYCDFNSHALGGDLPEDTYIEALIRDLQLESENESRERLETIFLGGGTPSLFSGDAIKRLLDAIDQLFDITDTEITLEANPGTFDQSNFDSYRRAGVNRLSLGAQSFSQEQLTNLGRIHQPGDIEAAYLGARAAGFERINVDLMFGLPNQTVDEALNDLSKAIEVRPEHISWYQLTIELNTVFYRFPPVTPDDDTLGEMTEQGHRLLYASGYDQYEVSAFALPGEAARHNLNYWQFGDYIGIGAGAHGKLTRSEGIVRTNKTRIPVDYMRNSKRNENRVSVSELKLEFLLNALRLTQGFELSLFEQTTGLAASELDNFIETAIANGFSQRNGSKLVPTEKGRYFLNDMLLLV